MLVPVPLPVLVLLPVLMWGCWLPLLLCVPPWPAPLLPVVTAPEPLPVPEPVPVPVPLPVLVLVLLAWPEPVPVPLPKPLPVPVPVPLPVLVLVVGLLASRFRPWRGFSLGPPGLRGGWKSGPGPEDFNTPPPLPPPLVVVCGGLPP